MIFLSQSKKIALIALSVFFVSLSVLFVLTSKSFSEEGHLEGNLFSAFFSGHEKEAEYQSFLDEKFGATLVLTKSGEFVDLNTAFSKMFQYEKRHFEGQEFFSFFHSEDLANFIGAFTKATQMKDEPEVYSGPFRFKAKDGQYRFVILSLTGKKSFVVIRYKDITESVEDLRDEPDVKAIRNLKDKDQTRIVVEKK